MKIKPIAFLFCPQADKGIYCNTCICKICNHKKIEIMKKIIVCIVSAVLLCGCEKTESSVSLDSIPVQDNKSEYCFEEENTHGYFPGNAIIPAGNEDYIFHVFGTTGIIYYENPLAISEQLKPNCDKEGCKHEDETCPAYVGQWSSISFYKDKFYYLCKDEDGVLILKELDPSNNERKIIYIWDKPENNWDDGSYLCMSYDNALVRKERWTTNINTGEQSYKSEIYCIDINTGEGKSVIKDVQDHTDLSIVGGNNKKIIFTKSHYDKEFVDVSLISVDIKTGKEKEITNTKRGLRGYLDTSHKISNDQLVYVRNDEIHLYDLMSEKDSIVYHMNDIVSYRYFDGKILLLTTADKNINDIKMYSYDYRNNQIHSIANYGNEDLNFSIDDETENGFISSVTRQWIRKSDFYNDDYDDIVTFW